MATRSCTAAAQRSAKPIPSERGMEEADAMLITGHKTTHVFRHYNLDDVEKLRERLAQSRGYVRSLPTQRKVLTLDSHRVPQTDTPEQHRVAR